MMGGIISVGRACGIWPNYAGLYSISNIQIGNALSSKYRRGLYPMDPNLMGSTADPSRERN